MQSVRLAVLLGSPFLLLLHLVPTAQAQCTPDAACLSGITVTPDVLLDSRYYEDLNSSWTLGAGWIVSNSTACQQELQFCTGNNLGDLEITCINSSSYVGATVQVEIEYTRNDTGSTVSPFEVNGAVTHQTTSPFMARYQAPTQNSPLTISPNASLVDVCITIKSVRVLVRMCPLQISDFIVYPEGVAGLSTQLSCVDNATGDPGEAVCEFTQIWNSPGGTCQCNAGFGSSSGQNECTACVADYYKMAVGNTNCTQCPENSNSLSSSTSCTCDVGYSRSDPSNLTSGCTECIEDYFMSGGECVPCPVGSGREVAMNPSMCVCLGNSTTSNGETTTMSGNCTGCIASHYLNGSVCLPCAENSMSSGFDDTECSCNWALVTSLGTKMPTNSGDACSYCVMGQYISGTMCSDCPSYSNTTGVSQETECTCEAGRVTPSGDGNTTTEGCTDCAVDYYLSDGTTCKGCPDNSERPTSPDMSICECREGYKRKDLSNEAEGCLPSVRFMEGSDIVGESEAPAFTVTISGSPSSNVIVAVEAVLVAVGDTITLTPLTFPANVASSQDLVLDLGQFMRANDDIALQEDVTYNLTLSSDDVIVENALLLTIEDDDVLVVGFEDRMLTFNESDSIKVHIGISNMIARDLVLMVHWSTIIDNSERTDDKEVTFLSGGAQTFDHPVALIDDSLKKGDKTYTFTLAVQSPSGVNVKFGDDTNFYGELTLVTIEDDEVPPADEEDDEGLGFGAIIGIAVGGVGLAILVLFIVLVSIVICRIRVNQQGYYATDEDKQVQPTMLRYSASLRSISSQTVVPVDGGRVEPKENEFYV